MSPRSRRSSRRRTRPGRATPQPALPPALALGASLTPCASLAYTACADVLVVADLAAERLRCRRACSQVGGWRHPRDGAGCPSPTPTSRRPARLRCQASPRRRRRQQRGGGVRRVRPTLRRLLPGVLADALGVPPTLARAPRAYATLLVRLIIERHGTLGRGLGPRPQRVLLVEVDSARDWSTGPVFDTDTRSPPHV
jgi:hypothetical protein